MLKSLIFLKVTPTVILVYEAPGNVTLSTIPPGVTPVFDKEREVWVEHLQNKRHKYQIREYAPGITEYKRCLLS